MRSPASSRRRDFGHRRRLWQHSPPFRRLVWLSGIVFLLFALAQFGAYQKQNTPPPLSPNTSQTSPAAPMTTQVRPGLNMAGISPALITPATPAPPPPAAGNAHTVIQNTSAPQDGLSQFPRVDDAWGEVLPGRQNMPKQGYRVFYLTTGRPEDVAKSGYFSPFMGDKNLNLDASAYGTLWQQNRKRIIAQETVSDIFVEYQHNELKNIPAHEFAAYWIGRIDVKETAMYEFAPKQSWAGVRILLNRHRIYESTAHAKPPVSVRLTPGTYVLEVEYVNNWHTVSFALDVFERKAVAQTADLKSPLTSLNLPSNSVVYVASVGRAEKGKQINVNYPQDPRPYVLILSSQEPVHWELFGHQAPQAVIYNQALQGSKVNAEGQPASIAWSGNLHFRPDAGPPQCKCQNGYLLCQGGPDSLDDIARKVHQWTGYPLAGINGVVSASDITIPQIVVTEEALAESRQNDDIEAQRQLCQRLSGT